MFPSKNDLDFGKSSVTGRTRAVNQDAIDILLPQDGLPALPPLLVLADGMGGHKGGEIASGIVLDAFREEYSRPRSDQPDLTQILRDCVTLAHKKIKEQAAKDPKLKGMGSTVVAAFVGNDTIHLINVGDSRAYILRDHTSQQISQDQSWVADEVRAGRLKPELAATHRRKNILSMAINSNRAVVTPILNQTPFLQNDVLLLCSDGLWGLLGDAILWAAGNELSPQEAADKLVEIADLRGSPDNVSVIIASHTGRQKVATASNEETRE